MAAATQERTRSEELEKEAGPATGAMPEAEAEPTAPVNVTEIVVDGNEQLGLFDAGGKKPTQATLKIAGGAIKLAPDTAFKKGTRVECRVVLVINDVAQKDVHDTQTSQVTDCVQKHTGRVTDLVVERVSPAPGE